MTTEALPQLSSPRLALRPVEPRQDVAPGEVHLDQLPLAVGAGPTCGIRLSTPGARPLHCLIVSTDGGVAVRRWAADTQLNGESFTESLLAVGDQITCGEVAFEVVEVEGKGECAGAPTGHSHLPPVTWPMGSVEGPIHDSANHRQSAPSENDPDSLQQTTEVLRLAENCQRLEDELAETRSLLTTLGEELLQTREEAALQRSKLLNRIDELEEDLAERDNLLALLQEALEQSTESLESDFGPPTSSDYDTESTANSATSLVTEPPVEWGYTATSEEAEQLEESGAEPSEDVVQDVCDPAPTLQGELATDRYMEEESSPTADPPTLPSSALEPQADLEWGQVSETPEAGVPEAVEEPAPAGSDVPSFPASDLPDEDLWDIEKSSNGATDSLWNETFSPLPFASPCPEPSASEVAPSQTHDAPSEPCQVEKTGSADGCVSDKPLQEGKSLDPWGSESLWQTSAAPHSAPEEGEIDVDRALLWGQSALEDAENRAPTTETCSDEESPETGRSESWSMELPETSASAAAHLEPCLPAELASDIDACPATDRNATDSDEALGVARMASTAQHEELDDEALEEPRSKPAAPVSYIEKYRHLLDDDQAEDVSSSAQPTPAPVVAPAVQSNHSENDDDSIEAYMAKMMARLRGESASERATAQAPPPPEPEIAPVEEPVAPPPKPSPLLSLDELKTAAAPERQTNMSALRDLANNSARHAIGMANSRRLIQVARTNLLLAGVATAAGAYLVWSAPGPTSLEMVGGLIGVGGASLWGCRTLSFLSKARRESRSDSRPEEEPCNTPAEQLLPIDVSAPFSAR